MEKIELKATSRKVLGKKTKKLRAKGLVPAVVYGNVKENEIISLDEREFAKVYKEAGSSALVDLIIDDQKPIKVIIHEPQHHHIFGKPVHVDFYAVKMSEKIETTIAIHFVGESLAVEQLEGNLVTNKDELNIKCLPADLIQNIEVDISALKTFDDQIKVSDIKLPETILVLDDPDEVVALVSEPISEEELEAELAEDKTAEEAAVEELGKEEAAEGVEGESVESKPTEEKAE